MRKYLLFLVFAMVFVSGCYSTPTETDLEAECSKDLDCVPASCCHATECVPAGEAPNCEGIMCTMECRPDTMDCGQGFCMCMDNKCKAVLK
ncbi:MAG: hypothetical protein KJ968_00325 [Nanoarchaeota archaeon]|nr:hypothetical protein [Nanoarchaeota archaeon]MBU4283532.1 hypothetical protein [Nanoarchaeota archaeon]